MVPFVLRPWKPYPQFLWLTLGITSAAARCLRYIYGWGKRASARIFLKRRNDFGPFRRSAAGLLRSEFRGARACVQSLRARP